jgi:hypothetical protein
VAALSGKAATREALRQALGAVERAAASTDAVLLALIGHGNVDGTVYKFNVPGADVTCDDLRQWLDRLPARRQLVVLATSAGGACLGPLARPGRVVMSATRSGSERNAPVFARYFIEALRDPGADRDHDEAVTALEAFRYTEQRVQRFYADQKRLATEHPMLSTGEPGDFVVAYRGATRRPGAGNPRSALALRKVALEDDLRALKIRKAALAREEYLNELEKKLLELARLQETLDAEGGTAP